MVENAMLRCFAKIRFSKIRRYFVSIIPSLVLNIALLPFVFVEPVQQWMGRKPFLCFALAHLAFFPGQNTLFAHIETSLLSLVISSLWLGLGFVIVCVQVWIDDPDPIYTSLSSRGLGAAYVFVTFFAAGLIWIRIPRFGIAMRVVMFTQTWIMTGSRSEITARNFTDMFYPLLVTGILSIFANALVPRTAHGQYFRTLSCTLSTLSALLDTSMKDYKKQLDKWEQFINNNPDNPADCPTFEQSERATKLLSEVKSQIQITRNALAASQYEIAWCVLPAARTKHLLNFVNDIYMWTSSGMGMSMPDVNIENPIFHEARASENQETVSISESLEPNRKSYTNPTNISIPQKIKMNHLTCSMTELISHTLDIIGMFQAMADYAITLKPNTYERKASTTFSDAIHQYRVGDAEKYGSPVTMLRNVESELEQSMARCLDQLRHLLCERGFNEIKSDMPGSRPATVCSSQVDVTRSSSPELPLQNVNNLFRKPSLFCPDMYMMSHLYHSLYHIAFQARHIMQESIPMVKQIMAAKRRHLYIPRVNLFRWIQAPSGVGMFNASEQADSLAASVQNTQAAWIVTRDADQYNPYSFVFDEDDQHNQYYNYARNIAKASRRTNRQFQGSMPVLDVIRGAILNLWRLPSVVNVRIELSSLLRSAKQSHHVQFALKLASGVTLFCIIPFLQHKPDDWWNANRGQWLVISYIFALESSTGNSFRVAIFRFIGTVLGCVLALAAYEIARGNVWGLCVFIALLDVPSSLMRMHFRYPSIGAVMGFTTPLVMVVSYFSTNANASVRVAYTRGYMIILGILAALLINLTVWPYHARIHLMRKMSKTTTLLQNLYLSLARQRLYTGFKISPEIKIGFRNIEQSVRSELLECDALSEIMTSEFSLVPKPVLIVRRLQEHLEMVFCLCVTLRACRENEFLGDRQEAASSAMPIRQEFVSSVVLDLWLVGQALVTRSRLPQSLPSTRRALEELISATALGYHELVYHDSNLEAKHRSIYDGPMIDACIDDHDGSLGESFHAKQMKAKTMGGLMYLLAEHSILLQIVFSLESLLQLMRLMLGELHLVHIEKS